VAHCGVVFAEVTGQSHTREVQRWYHQQTLSRHIRMSQIYSNVQI